MKIIIHCGKGGPDYKWSPQSLNDGIGGSEESVIYVSRELVKLGHDVAVYANCNPGTYDGVRWKFYTDPLEPASVLIAWRDWHIAEQLRQYYSTIYLWCHDVPVEPHWSPNALDYIKKAIVLNDYHAGLYRLSKDRAFVCSNGVDLEQFDQSVDRVPYKCIYFSHPHRGLEKLREYWPEIRAAYPEATLHAYWWQPEFFLPPDESIGIMPMMALGHEALAREVLSADLFTYPSTFDPEINPITCIKAQVGGAWPVAVIKGGMDDTLQFGSRTTHAEYVDTVIAVMERRDLIEKCGHEMMIASRIKYSWANTARKWQTEFEGL